MRALRDIVARSAIRYLPEPVKAHLAAWHYRRLLRSFCEEREPDFRVVRQLDLRDGLAVDVGASIGLYTRLLSTLVGEAGQVDAIEPVPFTFGILTSNIRAFGLMNVRPVQAVISASSGELCIEVPVDERGIDNHYLARVVKSPTAPRGKHFTAVSTTLDLLCQHSPLVLKFIKIDTEGHELACLQGGLRTIVRWRPAILVEISSDLDDPQSDGASVQRSLAEMGYECCWFDGTALRQRGSGDRSVNYFFLMPEHLGALEQKRTFLRRNQ